MECVELLGLVEVEIDLFFWWWWWNLRRGVLGGFFVPWGVEDLGYGDSGVRVWVEEFGDEAAGVSGEPWRAFEVPFVDFSIHCHNVVVLQCIKQKLR